MRHHYVPQFYLRRFANQKNQLRAFRRSTREMSRIGVRQAASEIGFYDVKESEDYSKEFVEELLGQKVENFAALAFQRLDETWPPSEEDRVWLALFMAVQIVRTPEQRFMMNEIADLATKLQIKGVRLGDGPAIDPLPVASEELESMVFPASPEFAWGSALEMAATKMAPMLAGEFVWHLFESDKRVLATSDRPVMYWVNEPDPLRGVGLGTADDVYMPVDSRKMLGLTRDRRLESSKLSLPRAIARQMNRYLLAYSYEWVYHDPRVRLFTPADLEVDRRPAFKINDRDVFESGDSWKHVSEWLDLAGPDDRVWSTPDE